MVYIDLEKAYSRVPRQEVWRRKKDNGVSDKYVIIAQYMYEGTGTRAKTNVGLYPSGRYAVGLQQGSSMGLYVFVISMDSLSCGIKYLSPWYLIVC